MKSELELVLDAKAMLGEGPCWHTETQKLYWVDISGQALHCYDPATGGDQTWSFPEPIGCVCARSSGGLLLALTHRIISFNPQTETSETICEIESNRSDTRLNDGKCDPKGRFWVGTMDMSHQGPIGSLYCLKTDLSLRTMESHIRISNGLSWNPDYTVMYYIDSPTHKIAAYDYDLDTGDISRKRIVIDVPEEFGLPDGMTADQEGMLWVAIWGGWRITRWNPNTAELLATYEVPVKNVTACCFGGPELTDLYITTARTGDPDGNDETQPHAGGLFRLKTRYKGLETFMFAG